MVLMSRRQQEQKRASEMGFQTSLSLTLGTVSELIHSVTLNSSRGANLQRMSPTSVLSQAALGPRSGQLSDLCLKPPLAKGTEAAVFGTLWLHFVT